jgi:DNA-binding NarL/FixJ family response regulator
MANKTILMSRIRQILRLYTQGQSNKKIRELTCSSRNTVKKYIHKFIHEHLTYDLISAMSDHELDRIEKLSLKIYFGFSDLELGKSKN